jgi:hypothetical protein
MKDKTEKKKDGRRANGNNKLFFIPPDPGKCKWSLYSEANFFFQQQGVLSLAQSLACSSTVNTGN